MYDGNDVESIQTNPPRYVQKITKLECKVENYLYNPNMLRTQTRLIWKDTMQINLYFTA